MGRAYKRKTVDRWSREDLLEALISIKDGKLDLKDASRQYGISCQTLIRHYPKFIVGGGKYDASQFPPFGGGSPPVLTRLEKDVFEKTVLDLRGIGYVISCTDIKRICFEYCEANGLPNRFNRGKRMAGDGWYYPFFEEASETEY